MSDALQGALNALDQTIAQFTNKTEERRFATFHLGSASARSSDELPIIGHFTEMGAWRDGGLRSVFVNEMCRAVVTYCEGDVSVEVYQTVEAYNNSLAVARTFYEGENS